MHSVEALEEDVAVQAVVEGNRLPPSISPAIGWR